MQNMLNIFYVSCISKERRQQWMQITIVGRVNICKAVEGEKKEREEVEGVKKS